MIIATTPSNVFTDCIHNALASESDSDLHTSETSMSENLNSNTKVTAKDLVAEQVSDPSLSTCWSLANKNKGSYFVKDGLLFHNDVIAGHNCEQLCVPMSRRQHILTLAHEVY